MNNIFQSISKYRTALMGLAIIGVMVAHCKMDWPVSIFSKLVGVFCYSIFTGGFLFLSGFGLYFSMSKDSSLLEFYRKRAKRLLLPWLCIATPYFLFMDVIHGGTWSEFLWHISTLSFWRSGNYSGMWYISVTVMLYVLYPLYYRIAYHSGRNRKGVLLVTIFAIACVEYLLLHKLPEYYNRYEIAMNISIFFLGSHVGYMVNADACDRRSAIIELGGAILLNALLAVILHISSHVYIVYNVASIFLWSWVFLLLESRKCFNVIIAPLNWLGKYTLELYMLHLFAYYVLKVFLPNVGSIILFPVAVVFALIACKPVHELIERLGRGL